MPRPTVAAKIGFVAVDGQEIDGSHSIGGDVRIEAASNPFPDLILHAIDPRKDRYFFERTVDGDRIDSGTFGQQIAQTGLLGRKAQMGAAAAHVASTDRESGGGHSYSISPEDHSQRSTP